MGSEYSHHLKSNLASENTNEAYLINKCNSLSFSTLVAQLSTYKLFLTFQVLLLVYSVVTSDPSLYFFRWKSTTSPNENELPCTRNANCACRKIFRSHSLLTHKKPGKFRSPSHSLICKNAFLMSAMIPIWLNRTRTSIAGIIGIKFTPFSKHWFREGLQRSLAETSNTGLTLIVPLSFTTGLWGK